MQAILTRYTGPSNVKGSRIIARCEATSVTMSYDYALNIDGNHLAACELLKAKMSKRNADKYGTTPEHDVWRKPTVCGQLPTGDYAHVFLA